MKKLFLHFFRDFMAIFLRVKCELNWTNIKSNWFLGEVKRPHRYAEQRQRQQAQKLAISNEVLDSAKEVILERQRSTKEEDQRVGLMKAMENKLESKLLIIEELLLRLTKNV